MNILPFHLNIPTEITLERPEGTLVQGRYGDRVMFSLADGRVMYVPPFVANKIQAEGVAAGERFELCKTQVKKGSRRSIEWIVRRLDPFKELAQNGVRRETVPDPTGGARRTLCAFEELACTTEPAEASKVPNGSGGVPGPVLASDPEPETPLEQDLRASIESVTATRNGNGHNGTHPNSPPAPPTKLEHALKTAISAAYNAERFGAELGYVVRFDADAIKSMAITVLINMSGGNHR